jgi:hypothetical protein
MAYDSGRISSPDRSGLWPDGNGERSAIEDGFVETVVAEVE